MITAFIPARGGSKSIPLKNIKSICGKPLIYWSLNSLQNSDLIDRIVVATDSSDIKNTVNSFCFSKVIVYDRDEENARDTSSTESVMLEYINKTHFNSDDLFMLVQATSPFITLEDVNKAITRFKKSGADSLLSVVRTKRFFWNSNGTPLNYDYKSRPRRQDFDGMFMENGAFYINSIENIKKERNRLSGKIELYEMPEFTALEIDEPDDLYMVEHLMRLHITDRKIKTKQIKLFLTDVDGVLTDAGMYYSENGDELKKFNTLDGKGFELLRKAGIKTGIITSENTRIVSNRAKKLKIDYLYQGVDDKLKVAMEICKLENITLEEVAYIGDDINDFELLSSAGIAACPVNAVKKIKGISDIVQLSTKGGDGAVREFAEIIVNI